MYKGKTPKINPFQISGGLIDKLNGNAQAPTLDSLLELVQYAKMGQAAAILDCVLEELPEIKLRIVRKKRHEWEGSLLGTGKIELRGLSVKDVSAPSLASMLVNLLRQLTYYIYTS